MSMSCGSQLPVTPDLEVLSKSASNIELNLKGYPSHCQSKQSDTNNKRYLWFCVHFETGSQVVRAGLELIVWLKMTEFLIFLPLSPKFCDYRQAAAHPVYGVLGIGSRALCMLGKYSTN